MCPCRVGDGDILDILDILDVLDVDRRFRGDDEGRARRGWCRVGVFHRSRALVWESHQPSGYEKGWVQGEKEEECGHGAEEEGEGR